MQGKIELYLPLPGVEPPEGSKPKECSMGNVEIGDVVSYNGLTFHVVDTAGMVIGISTVPNPGTSARVMWVSPTRVKKISQK